MAGKASKRELAIAALLSEPTQGAAAAKVGVSPRTLKGWLTEPEFAARYRAARLDVVERTVARLVRASAKAVERLERNLDAESVPGSNRAAELILTLSAKGVEAMDLRGEMEDLRRQVAELRELNHGDGSTPPGIATPADGGAGGEGEDAAGEPETPGGDRPVS